MCDSNLQPFSHSYVTSQFGYEINKMPQAWVTQKRNPNFVELKCVFHDCWTIDVSNLVIKLEISSG